jgi:hypothetical protein
MSLRTYDRSYDLHGTSMPWPFYIIGEDGEIKTVDETLSIFVPAMTFAPGEWVTHRGNGGRGIIVAVNDDSLTVLWSIEPREDIGAFTKFAFPLMRRVYPQLVANQIVQVQPMSLSTGLTFYHDYVYGESKWEKRCKEGPLWRRIGWRLIRWSQQRMSSLVASLRSSRPRQLPSTSTSCVTSETGSDAYENMLKEKWAKGLGRSNP